MTKPLFVVRAIVSSLLWSSLCAITDKTDKRRCNEQPYQSYKA